MRTRYISMLVFAVICFAAGTAASDFIQDDPISINVAGTHEKINLLRDIPAINADETVNCVIEIPAGSTAKFEVDKKTGCLKQDLEDGSPRFVKYLGYPVNYGYIPSTYLDPDNGGDGDPIDVLIPGPAIRRGSVLKGKILGVHRLVDRGQCDDKIIVVVEGTPFYEINTLKELEEKFPGVLSILRTWFLNYKGRGKMKFLGWGGRYEALMEIRRLAESFASKRDEL